MYKVSIAGIKTSDLKTLSQKTMEELMIRIKEGDEEARNLMINGNLKLVLSVIKKFSQRNEQADDLFQVGCIGLIKAIDNFDFTHDVKFSTYAVPMIIGEIRRYIRDNSSIRVSRSLKDIAYKTLSFKEQFIRDHHREPTIDEIASALEVDPIDVLSSLEAIQDPVSIFSPIYDNGSDVIELIDQISDDNSIDDNWEKEKMLNIALSNLDERVHS